MDMTGEYRIPASRDTVWRALNDPEVLKRSIPGCEDLQKTSETEMTARVSAKVGPVSARFTGKVTLSDINPPVSYRISGEGQGGVAGFAKGGAEVKLDEDGAETVLRYKATAQVGGKLAQIGSRLIDSTAKKMADQFFGKFVQEVGGARPTVPAAGTVPGSAAAETPPEAGPMPTGIPGAEATRAEPPRAPTAAQPIQPAQPSGGGIKPAVWIAGLIAVVVILLLIFAL
jgi:carbon monoxide dehydrogenase subunit G